MAMHQGTPFASATVRGTLRQMVAKSGAEFAIALVTRAEDDGVPMRITRGNYEQLTIRNGLEQPVVCRCDGQGLWFLQIERPAQ